MADSSQDCDTRRHGGDIVRSAHIFGDCYYLLVAAEMLGVEFGIGAYILEAGSLYDLERLFVGVMIQSLTGVLVCALISMLEKRLLRWRA